MGIKPVCDMNIVENCEGELKQFGGLLFSPPDGRNVKKFHVCVPCFEHLTKNTD